MPSNGFSIICYSGSPPPLDLESIEISIGSALPIAFGGLRALIRGLHPMAPTIVDAIAAQYAIEWNELFPNTFPDAPKLAEVALSPSERRLHRESEQVFRILQAGACVLVSALEAVQRPLVLRHAGMCDLVSLRAIMRAAEWSRVKPISGEIALAEWSRHAPLSSKLMGDRRELYARHIQERLRAELRESKPTGVAEALLAPDDAHQRVMVPEELYFRCLTDCQQPPENRIAAAVRAIRSCFFSSNYEGSLLASEQGLEQLAISGVHLNIEEVKQAFNDFGTDYVTAAIEINQSNLNSPQALTTFFWRSAGVTYSLMGDHVAALSAFERALEVADSEESKAHIYMFKGLILSKRSFQAQDSAHEIRLGLKQLEGLSGQAALLEQGWLRNVLALTYTQQGHFDQALTEEKLALKCVRDIATPSATHLKINLISNLSVLQEISKHYEAALNIWYRFMRFGDKWDENFAKHHHYREATLQLKAGHRDKAINNLIESYNYAKTLRDFFHQQAVACELGRIYLEGGSNDQATIWFTRACEAAREIGDPFRLGESLLGYALATQQYDWEAVLCYIKESTTYRDQAKRLRAALECSPDPATLIALLPRPRSKLNRPFDLVNVNLFAGERATVEDSIVKGAGAAQQQALAQAHAQGTV